ncbi:Ribonuclease E [Streptomyces sp. YIM 130001]|uniref:ribonuclease E/G n=1 Tax=Streptomyces sp. YIM 130001 TaxID=2259644 RepID=UPI000E64610C|nr:ribonuclease E/G [Streptomyces sp. YIM 130001]RII08696.1 Ribonuclease E [Streptomyces sp. YIM 130001]
MLESNDPGLTGDAEEQNDAPGDKLPPRRRRRAASRPAGPPVAADTGTAAAPQADEELQETPEETEDVSTDGGDSAPAAAEPVVEPARTRRRATRRASAPAGAPRAADNAPAEPVPSVPDEPVAVASAPQDTEPADDAAPKRSRRRATRKVTAPAGTPTASGEDENAPSAAEPVRAEAPTAPAEPASAAADEDPAPRGRSRRRSGRRAESPAGAPEAVETAAEPEAAAKSETAAQAEAPAAEQDAEAETGGRRGRRRSSRKSASMFTAPEPGSRAAETGGNGETAEAEEKSGGRGKQKRPAVAVFQAPVFTEPMFQTPERAAAAAAAEAAQEPAEEPAEEETTPRRRRRRRAEQAESPAPSRPEPQETTEERADEAQAEDEPEAAEQHDGEDGDEQGGRQGRRRRRGGRRRRRGEAGDGEGGEAQDESDDAEASDEQTESEDDAKGQSEAGDEDRSESSGSSSSRRRRRRRRRAGDSGQDSEPGDGDPERTVVKVREPRPKSEASDEVQSIKGSTRLEAKKQRRREGREQGRRRVPIITEAEFLARREAVERVMVVRENGERTQIGVLEDDVLVEHYVNKEQSTSYVGNVYLGKVQNVLPSMEAAFIDIGKGRNAVLYAGEVNFEALGMANGPRRIETALKSGQSVLVQVTKDPIGHKGARLTSQVSLPGRYLVYVPEGSMTGISRKLPDTERARLKTILKKIVPEDAGVIVRTAAEGASEDELRRDVERLQAQWEEIRKKSKTGNAPTLLYGEPDMTVRVVRDIFNEDFTKVIVSGETAWETIHGYVSHVAPDLVDRLQKWTSEVDVFATYRIDEQLMKALDRKVWLPSGGSLVIDKTEAMIVIDVNTGKFTGQGGNLEETVTRNNLEAAEEIVRQLRLRDLGGIVVIDFIDMVLESNRDLVMRRLLECLGRDRTKHQVAEVTSLGLIQMTRKRVGQGLLESFSETCVHCNGRGVIVHMEQPTSSGNGSGNGGKRSKKRGRGGDQAQEHTHEHTKDDAAKSKAEPEPETEAEVAAEAAAPVKLAEPDFKPDEELYGSAAEAEAAAGRGGRSRRRASRKASAPAGSPKQAEEAPAAVVEAPADEPEAVQEAAPAVPETVEAAPAPRTRRRASRKASAPAGSPKAADEAPATVTVEAPAPEAPVAEPAAAAPVEAPVAEPAAVKEPAARPRRRAVRKAAAPTSAEDAAVVVVASGPGDEAEGDAADEAAPAKKAARKTVKKATAKKAATKKTAAKKTTTAAKKTTTAKKATKAKKTAAAEQPPASGVSAPAENA